MRRFKRLVVPRNWKIGNSQFNSRPYYSEHNSLNIPHMLEKSSILLEMFLTSAMIEGRKWMQRALIAYINRMKKSRNTCFLTHTRLNLMKDPIVAFYFLTFANINGPTLLDKRSGFRYWASTGTMGAPLSVGICGNKQNRRRVRDRVL